MCQDNDGVKTEHIVTSVIFLILLISLAYVFPRWADPNQNSRLDMVIAIVDDGTFQIDPYVANTVDYARVGEHYYSDKAPGTAFFGVPLYWILKQGLNIPVLAEITERLASHEAFQATLRPEGTGVMVQKVRFALAQTALAVGLSAIPTALTGVLLYRLTAEFSSHRRLRIGLVLGYGLLTPVFAYGGALYGYQLSAMFLLFAFACVFFAKETISPGRAFGIGLLLGLSVLTEYPTLLLVGIVFVYAVVVIVQQGRPTQALWIVLGGSLPAGLLMAYNNTVFGGPFELGYAYSELWQEQHHAGFMSLNLPSWEAFWGITFSPFRGLFLLSPWLLLAVPGVIAWWRRGERRLETGATLAMVTLFFLFNISSVMWWGGYAVGPRYLLPMVPFLVLPITLAVDRWWSMAGFRWVLFLMLGWSWLATWGLSLAEQVFPPDNIANPLVDYALPNWRMGNVARNLGTLMGLKGALSIVPLIVVIGLLIGLLIWKTRRSAEGETVVSDSEFVPVKS